MAALPFKDTDTLVHIPRSRQSGLKNMSNEEQMKELMFILGKRGAVELPGRSSNGQGVDGLS